MQNQVIGWLIISRIRFIMFVSVVLPRKDGPNLLTKAHHMPQGEIRPSNVAMALGSRLVGPAADANAIVELKG